MSSKSSNLVLKIVASILSVVCLIGILQFVLPDEFQPYNIVVKPAFDKTLESNEQYSVSKIIGCNLDVQYPSKINSKKMELYQLYKNTQEQNDTGFVGSFAITNNQEKENQDPNINPAVISCSKNPKSFGELPSIAISSAKFYRTTGLFVGHNNTISDLKTDSNSDYGIKKFSFKKGDLYYIISLDTQKQAGTDNFAKGVLSHQVELQFSDFVKSKESSETKLIPIIKQ